MHTWTLNGTGGLPGATRTDAGSAPAASGGLRDTLRAWLRRARSRRDLRAMLALYAALGGGTPWQDLGASRGELLREARKPFWRA